MTADTHALAWPRCMPWVVGLTTFFFFLLDLLLPLGVAGGIPYIIPLILSFSSAKTHSTWILSLVISFLIVAGYYLSPEGGEMWKVVANRCLALIIVWAVCGLLLFQQRQSRLAQEVLFENHATRERDIQKLQLYQMEAAVLLEQLTQERYLMEALTCTLPDSIYFKDRSSRFILVNEACMAILGASDKSEVIGRTDADFYSDEEAEEFRSDEETIMATGQAMINKEQLELWPDGKAHTVLATKMPLLDKDGNCIGTFGLSRDITELKKAQQEIAEVASHLALPPRQEQFLNSALYLSRFSLRSTMVCSAAIRSLSQHHESETALSQAVAEWLYRHILDDAGQPAFALARLFQVRKLAELEEAQQQLARKAVPELKSDALCLTLTGTVGERLEWSSVASSVNHQVIPLPGRESIEKMPMVSQLLKQLGAEVPDSSTNLSGLFFQDRPGVFHIEDARGSAIIPDQQFFVIPFQIRSVVGFGGALPNGSLFVVILFARCRVSVDQARLLSHLTHSIRLSLLSFHKGGNRIQEQIRALDELLQSHEQIVVEQDERLQEALRHLSELNQELRRSNEELDSFAYIASHDLRAPLRNIGSILDWIEEDEVKRLSDQGREHLGLLRGCMSRMNRLLSDLLQFSRTGRLESEPEEVDLTEVVEEVLLLLSPPGGMAIEIEGTLPRIVAPRTAIRKVLQNLVDNAVKHHDKPNGNVRISGREEADRIVIEVQDDGPGIPPRFHEKIFQVFQSLHQQNDGEGSGIGLAIVRKTVETYGGDVQLTSSGGRGSTFRFSWPQGELEAMAEEKGVGEGATSYEQ